MVIVFDVDGTLIGGEEQDWPSFDQALESELGLMPDEAFWKTITEVTGKAIVRSVCEVRGMEFTDEIVERVNRTYLQNLRKAAPFKNTVFLPKPGAVEILNMLKSTPIFDVAIATGDFAETSKFKLQSAGIPTSGIPHVSASDREVRADIISLAAEKAGYQVHDAIYVGDGLWDMRACEQLDIPFIGTGRNIDKLKAAGVESIVTSLEPTVLLPMIQRLV